MIKSVMIKFTSPVKYVLRDLSGCYYSGMGSDGAPNITATRAHAKLVSRAQANDILCRFGRCNFRAYKAKVPT